MLESLSWLLQWPIRALILLLVSALPLGIEMANFSTAFWSAVMIGLLGTLLIVLSSCCWVHSGPLRPWGADLASVVFVQLVDHDPFICSGSLVH